MITTKEELQNELIRIDDEAANLIQSLDIGEDQKRKLITKYLLAMGAVSKAWDSCHPGEKD